MKRKITKIGNKTVGIAIPPAYLDILKIERSNASSYQFDMDLQDGKIILSNPQLIIKDSN